MKTISELNSRWWYRLIKVLFLLLLVLIFLFSFAVVYTTYHVRNVSDYLVTCDYGNKKTFDAYKDAGIQILSFNLDGPATVGSLNDYEREAIQKACGITSSEAVQMLRNSLSGNSGIPSLFVIQPTTVTEGSTLSVVLFSALSLLIILITFEFIRRMFYYIVLGKIRPPKA